MTLVNSPKECLLCLNSNKTVFVPTEESQKIFNVCCSYVKDAINIEFLINNIIGNNSRLSFCKNCLDISLNLSQLVEQLSKIKKEISDVSSKFSETITKQRATTNTIKKEINNGNSKFQATSNHKTNLVVSDRLLLDGLPISDNEKDSAASTESINEEIAIDKIGSEVLKTERMNGVFPDYEDESCTDNTSGYIEEEFEANYLVIEDEREVDPFGEIEQESSSGIVDTFDIAYKMEPQIGASHIELDSSFTMPNIVLARIPHDFTIKRSDTFSSTKTAHHGKPCIAMHESNRNDVHVNKCSVFNSTTPSHPDKQGINVQESSFGNSHSSSNFTEQKSNLKRKSKITKGRVRVYKFICSICQKSFYTSNKLKMHHMIHTGEKPYKCLVCEKAFIQSGSLKTHERIHTGETPYKCLVCEKSFNQLGTLKNHEKVHTGEKPYKCSVCVKAFTHVSALNKHLKTSQSHCRNALKMQVQVPSLK